MIWRMLLSLTYNDMSIKIVALNRIIGKVHLDSVTDVKQTSVFARLLFLYFVINQVCDKCGDTGNMGNPTLSEPDGQRCDCIKQTCL